MTSVESGSAAPALADKLSALVARTQRPATAEAPAAAADTASLADLTGELRGDLMSELGDLRAQIAAVGDEATEASGRSNNRAHEIAETIGHQGDAAERRATRVEERLDALEAKVEAFALDLSASMRTEGQRVEAAVRAAVEEAALVLAETLLMALPAGAPPVTPVAAVVEESAVDDAVVEEPSVEEPSVEAPSVEAQAEVIEAEVIEEPADDAAAVEEPVDGEEELAIETPAAVQAPTSFTTPAPDVPAQGRFFGRSRR